MKAVNGRHTLRDMLPRREAETSPFVCTHRDSARLGAHKGDVGPFMPFRGQFAKVVDTF